MRSENVHKRAMSLSLTEFARVVLALLPWFGLPWFTGLVFVPFLWCFFLLLLYFGLRWIVSLFAYISAISLVRMDS